MATAMLRALAAPVDHVRVAALYESAPFLHPVFELDTLADLAEEKVRAYVAKLLSDTRPERSNEELDCDSDDWHKIWTDHSTPGFVPDPTTLPFPPDKPKTAKKKEHIATQLKACTPSTRIRIRSMVSSVGSAPTDDPLEMAKISRDFWRPTWAARNSPCPKAYLSGHKNRLPFGHLIPLPKLEQIVGAIMSSNDSAPGPDGIPYLAYRLLVDLVAPVLLDVFGALARGVKPPSGFNDGCLFLLPKKGDGTATLPTNTRPLAVNNCDNRIIARVAAYIISPSLSKQLHPNQKGFVPGRQGSEHIHDLNEEFYSAIEEERNQFILSIDTKKAFDSIHVDYLHAVLRALNLPEWLNHLVAGLYFEARVTPVFGSGHSDIWIDILRGVRQGCPLSPLLFAIAFDPLIERLRTVAGVRTFAFADDLAFSASSARFFSPIMAIISQFSAISGLGINTDKTAIIAAQDVDLRAWISTTCWPDLKQADEITYLGVRMGRLVNTEDVYEVAFDKLQKRARSFYPLTRTLTVYKRVLLVNIFLLPLLYYLFQFFHFPPRLSRLLDAILRDLVIPLRTSYKLAHLFLPRRRVAVQVALRHPWAHNNALLSAQGDFAAWSGRTGAPSLPHTSMRIRTHILTAVCDVVNWEMGYGVGMDDDDAVFDHHRYTHTDPRMMRRRIYNSMINVCANHADVDADVARKLDKWELIDATPAQLNTHFHAFSPKLNAHIRYVQFAMLFNALLTDRRYSPVRAQLGGGVLIDVCYICGDGEDAVKHLYGEGCLVVCDARRRFGLAIGSDFSPGTLQASCVLQVSLLAFPFVGPPLTHAVACFNWAVWHSSRTYFKTLGHTPASDGAAARICEMASNAWLEVAEPGWHRPAGSLPQAAYLRAAPRPAHQRNAFGSAGKRTPQQRANCAAYAAALLSSCGTHAAIAFTDGAAAPNPGPCGAGATISLCGKHQADLAQPIGQGTNNNGELWAIGMVATYLADRPALLEGCCALFLLSDSKLIVEAINGEINYTSEPKLLVYVLSQLARVTAIIPYSVQWTPGHCGSAGNNAADALAGAGAARNGPAGPSSFRDLLPPDLQ
jgi:ribonuclease HI